MVIISFQHGTSLGGSAADTLVRYSHGVILLSFGAIGWLTTLYQLSLLSERKNSVLLKKELSRSGNNKEIYLIFKSKGGLRRLSIMESMDGPKLRNEIARTTKTDWKEVDRNLRILKSVDLVRTQSPHEAVSVYELTEKGKEVLHLVKAILGETS